MTDEVCVMFIRVQRRNKSISFKLRVGYVNCDNMICYCNFKPVVCIYQ